MNVSEFTYLLNHPNAINEKQAKSLETVLDNFPYFQSARALHLKGLYNLAFGDFNEKTNSIDDFSITNNGDSIKVLATVASTVYAFTEKYPKAWIFATGSTSVRTRLYRMGITNNLAEIKEDFKVFGLTIVDNKWEEFIVGEDYEAFLITKKENL